MKKGVGLTAFTVISGASFAPMAQAGFITRETVVAWAPTEANVGREDPGYDPIGNKVHLSISEYYVRSAPGIVANGRADYLLPSMVNPFGMSRPQTVPIFEDVDLFSYEHGLESLGGGGGVSSPQRPPVPEPGSLVLLGIGAVTMCGKRRSR